MALLGALVWAASAAGWFSFMALLAIPGDPKNAVLGNFSSMRLLMTAGLLLAATAPALAWLLVRRRWAVTEQFDSRATEMLQSLWLRIGAWLFLLLGLVYIFNVPFVTAVDRQAVLLRLGPFIGLAFSLCLLLLLYLSARKGKLSRRLVDYLAPGSEFISRHPAFIYGGVAVFLIVVAQLIDQSLLPLNVWINASDTLVSDWEIWTEETFEMIAAVEFGIATLVFQSSEQAPE